MECRRGATCCQGAAPGGGHTHKTPVLLPAALPPGNQEPCSDFPRGFPVLWPLLLPKPLCPLLPDRLCLHKHLKPRSLGALRAAILNPSAHSQPANSRVLPPSSRPLARTCQDRLSRGIDPSWLHRRWRRGPNPHSPRPRSLGGTGPARRSWL